MKRAMRVKSLKQKHDYPGEFHMATKKQIDNHMKKIIYSLLALACIAGFYACDNVNALHQPYFEEGEIIYRSKPDTLFVFSGNGRALVNWVLSGDSKISKTIISANGVKSEVDIQRQSVVDTFSRIINDLEEGNYEFQIINKDNNGNMSLPVSVFANVYGELYRSQLLVRSVDKIVVSDPVNKNATISWKSAGQGETGLRLEYLNRNNEKVEIYVPGNILKTDILNFLPGGDIKYQSYFLPEENAIDSFATNIKSEILPR